MLEHAKKLQLHVWCLNWSGWNSWGLSVPFFSHTVSFIRQSNSHFFTWKLRQISKSIKIKTVRFPGARTENWPRTNYVVKAIHNNKIA